jgi:hypothetical protein
MIAGVKHTIEHANKRIDMSSSVLTSRSTSLNGRAGAIALAVAACAILVLSLTATPLAPLRILTLSVSAFAVWSFCDEMGLKKPLNRAGLVFFSMAAVAKLDIALGLAAQFVGRYDLLYATFTLLAVMFWSIALLHRQRKLKVVGAIGVLATLAPLAAIIAGHIVVGLGAAIGVQSMLAATEGASPTDLSFVTTVERIFGIWSYAAAWLLWRGHIGHEAMSAP